MDIDNTEYAYILMLVKETFGLNPISNVDGVNIRAASLANIQDIVNGVDQENPPEPDYDDEVPEEPVP